MLCPGSWSGSVAGRSSSWPSVAHDIQLPSLAPRSRWQLAAVPPELEERVPEWGSSALELGLVRARELLVLLRTEEERIGA